MNFNHLLESKVTAPELPADFLERKSCITFLKNALKNNHACIQSPSGFGKSTLARSYVQQAEKAFAWISLEASENNVNLLLDYICFALSNIEITFSKTISLISAGQAVPDDILIEQFIKEWNRNKVPFNLVLDDVHYLKEEKLVDLIFDIMYRAPEGVKVILVSRKEINTHTWKEVSLFEVLDEHMLKFTEQEFESFIRHTSTKQQTDYSEGWITGIKLNLYSSGKGPAKELIKKAVFQFSKPEDIFFLTCLNYFDEEVAVHVTGNPDLLTNLKTSPLILIRAEKNNEYRFHHFVQETLQTIQPINLGSSIQVLKRKCFNFYLTKSRYKEALDLALDINEEQLISASFAEFRLQCFNQAMLRPISDTLDRLMISAISDSPIHKLTSAWVEVYKGNTEGMINKLNSIDVNTIPRNSLSEYWVLKSYEYYVIAKPNEAIKASSKAFELGFENKYAEGYYYIFRLASLHSTGQMKQAFTEGLQALSMTSSDLVKTQILLVLCYISRFESKQQRQYDYANALLKLAEENQNYEAITNALCFLGEYHYNLGELKIAEKLLKRAHELKHHTIGIIGISITWLYSKTLFNFGRTKFAHSIIQTQIDKLTKDGNWFILDFLKGMRAHLNLFSNTESSKEWLNNTEFNPHLPITEVYSPLLTKHLVEVTLGVESVNFLQSATDSLSKGNYKRPEAECLLSYAIYCLKKKDKTSAKKQISRALRLMPFHSFKQIYDDYAQHSAELKKTVLKLADSGVAKGVASTVKLTNREYQVAQLYDSRMTDQEIANTLGISLATVKRHNVNIFNKLQVRSKRQAIIELKKV